MRVLLLVALAMTCAPLLVPLSVAQVVDGPVTILVYHAPGGPEPDPLATPLAPPPGNLTRLPATSFDRVERADTNPENQPERADAHFREIQRALRLREAVPTPVRVTLGGSLGPGQLEVEAELALPAGDTNATGPLVVELILFEHDEGPYAARLALDPIPIQLPATLSRSVRLDPAWTADRLGVVLAVVDEDGAVLQSATWLVRDDAPTTQTTRAVLIEHVTASWCEPCHPADDALALLAEQRGAAGGPLASGEAGYLRAPTWRLWAGLALGAAAGVALARRARA